MYERKNHIYKKAMEQNKLQVALNANVAVGKMAGLYDKGEIEQKTPDIITVGESDMSKPRLVSNADTEE